MYNDAEDTDESNERWSVWGMKATLAGAVFNWPSSTQRRYVVHNKSRQRRLCERRFVHGRSAILFPQERSGSRVRVFEDNQGHMALAESPSVLLGASTLMCGSKFVGEPFRAEKSVLDL